MCPASGKGSRARNPVASSRQSTQDALEASVKQIVLAAYQLDNYGDLGDADKAQEAFRTMNAAILQLDSLVSEAAADDSAQRPQRRSCRGARARAGGDAHKGITSKFTYNADVYPVFLNRCSRCHIDGGVGPMSLLKYEDAFPWAESLRAELLDAATGDPHDFVKAAHRQISARELDIVLDWATGGTPEGDKARHRRSPSLRIDWACGHPDVIAADAKPLST